MQGNGRDDTIVLQSARRRAFYHSRYDSQALRRFVEDPDRFLEAPGAELIKSDATSTVAISHFGRQSLVIKRYNIKGAWHAGKRAFRRSRAELSWHNAILLQQSGIFTPNPVIALEIRRRAIRTRAYYVTELVSGPLCADFFSNPANVSDRAVSQLVDIFKKMIKHRLSHGDMKATNIIMTPRGPVLLDLDATRRHRCRYYHRHRLKRDKKRLLKNWQNDAALQRRFIRHFDGIGL